MQTYLRGLALLCLLCPLAGACDSSNEGSSDTGLSQSGKGGQGGVGAAGAAGKATGGSGAGGSGGSSAGTGGKGGASGSGAGSAGKGGKGGSAGQAGAGSAGGGASAGGGGAAGGCAKDGDCTLAAGLTPAGCAVAVCDQGVCRLRGVDQDGDNHRIAGCVADDDTPIEVGDDCDDGDGDSYPGHWDGPAGDGKPGACDGKDNDCSGVPDSAQLPDGTTCTCKVGEQIDCSEDSFGNPIAFPTTPPKGACKPGKRLCGAGGVLGPCLGAIGPASETCNGLDDDCDGVVDDNALDAQTWTCDGDSDGFAPVGGAKVQSCQSPSGGCEGPSPIWTASAVEGDCDDTKATISPNAAEVCDVDGKDENCNGQVNEGCTCANGTAQACFVDPSGNPIPNANGGAIGECKAGSQTCTGGQWGPCLGGTGPSQELCANLGKDNDCDGDADDADDKQSWTCDGDNDGFAPPGAKPVVTCSPPPGGCPGAWKLNMPTTDCDDTRAAVNPNAVELCDGAALDENCNGEKNEGCSCANGQTQICFVDPGGNLIPNANGKAIGECKAGSQTCAGGLFGPCLGGVGPKPEVCDGSGKDNDCDGKPNTDKTECP